MAQLLSKTLLCLWLVMGCLSVFAQPEEPHNSTDYKEPKQFEKFYKRRNIIGAWQINQLKKGALVVRLKTNKKLIDALEAEGKPELALQKRLEQYAINKNIMFAYQDNLKFCKVYFIYSNSSDSLLDGIRSGIFIDTTMAVNPNIVMSESFYMIAERDYAYNSSIGFVPEDSARYTLERGNPIKEMAIVMKNKYGHQVKNPFPYYVKEKSTSDTYFSQPISYSTKPGGGISIVYIINKTYLQDLKDPTKARVPLKNATTVKVRKDLTYEKVSFAVSQLDDYLKQYYQRNPPPRLETVDSQTKLFLY